MNMIIIIITIRELTDDAHNQAVVTGQVNTQNISFRFLALLIKQGPTKALVRILQRFDLNLQALTFDLLLQPCRHLSTNH